MHSSGADDLSCFAQEHVTGKDVCVKRVPRIHFFHSHPTILTAPLNVRAPLSFQEAADDGSVSSLFISPSHKNVTEIIRAILMRTFL